MSHPIRTTALAVTLAFAGASASSAPATPATPADIPLESFFSNAVLATPKLSPSGDALAIVMRTNGHRVLATIDTATLKRTKIVASFDDADVDFIDWVNDKRLVFTQAFENGLVDHGVGLGLWAVARDGTEKRQLIRSDYRRVVRVESLIPSRALPLDNYPRTTIRDGSGNTIVEHGVAAPNIGTDDRYHLESVYTVAKFLDTETGLARPILESGAPEHAQRWVFDDRGQPKAVFTLHRGEMALLAVKDGAWKDVARFPAYEVGPGSIRNAFAGVDGSLYIVHDSGAAGNTSALYRFDIDKWQADTTPVVSIKGFDFGGDLIQDLCTRKVLGVHYTADAPGMAWFDPAMAAVQAKVDAALPGRSNRIDIASCAAGTPALVTSSSDHMPAQYFLFGPGDAGLRSIGSTRPEIDPRLMGDTDFYRIKARDGHDLPVWVTKPRGKGPWPTVVLAHGGVGTRGWTWEWDSQSQFLASRGYLVVKPEPRGSAGYGSDLMASGFKQWGLAIQDDIADATRWAAAQGWADARRTCISGENFGGYSAMMGLVRYPELYRCGIASSAVADIAMIYDTWWTSQSEDWKAYGMPALMGDKVADAGQLAATSPLKLAAHIRQPLLLKHGALDKQVPIEQANAMRSALKDAKAPVTWIYYPEEGAGLFDPQDRYDYYRRMQAFLDAHLGSAEASPTAD